MLQTALEKAGAKLEHVVRTRMFVTDVTKWEEVARVHGDVFKDVRPATSMSRRTPSQRPIATGRAASPVPTWRTASGCAA